MYDTNNESKDWGRLYNILQDLKKRGYRVFICEDKKYCYGYIYIEQNDEKHILSINLSDLFHLWDLSYNYLPTAKLGSSVGFHDTKYLAEPISDNYIQLCITYGRNYTAHNNINTYSSLKQFLQYRGEFVYEI